jgi:hypothetical protein
MPFESYEPDPNRLAAAPGARLLWRQIREDAPLSPRLTQDAAKASEAKPTKRGGKPSASPTESAEAAEVGLCG